MRSLTWKLVLAFLLVSLISVVLVALLVSQRTRSEFDRFLSARDRDVFHIVESPLPGNAHRF